MPSNCYTTALVICYYSFVLHRYLKVVAIANITVICVHSFIHLSLQLETALKDFFQLREMEVPSSEER